MYDLTVATSADTRRVDSLTSDSSVATDNVLATHSRPGSSAEPREHAGGPVAPPDVHAGCRQRWRDGPVPLDAVGGQPVGQGVLPVSDRQRVGAGRPALDLTAQRIEAAKLLGRDLLLGQPVEREQQRAAGTFEGVGGPTGRRGRVVELVGEAGGQGAEGDQRLTLPRRRLDAPRGPVQPGDQVPTEGKPAVDPRAQHLGRHAQHPTGVHSAAGGQIHAFVVPRAEPTGPAAGHVHPAHDGVLPTDVPQEVDGTVKK